MYIWDKDGWWIYGGFSSEFVQGVWEFRELNICQNISIYGVLSSEYSVFIYLCKYNQAVLHLCRRTYYAYLLS